MRGKDAFPDYWPWLSRGISSCVKVEGVCDADDGSSSLKATLNNMIRERSAGNGGKGRALNPEALNLTSSSLLDGSRRRVDPGRIAHVTEAVCGTRRGDVTSHQMGTQCPLVPKTRREILQQPGS